MFDINWVGQLNFVKGAGGEKLEVVEWTALWETSNINNNSWAKART